MPLIHLIYTSSLIDIEGECLPWILGAASSNNTRNGITSMTLFADGSIIQVLEGNASKVQQTFDRIVRNPKQRGATLVTQEAIASRALAGVSLGLLHVSSDMQKNMPANTLFFKCTVREIKLRVRPGNARDLLVQFAELAGAAP
jgi:hypothetical protein